MQRRTGQVPVGCVVQPRPAEGRDHMLKSRLSRGGFEKILREVLEEVPESGRTRVADEWCEELMRVARLRRITWWPSIGWAETRTVLPTVEVQAALENVLDATPAPRRRVPPGACADDRLADSA